MLEKEKSSSSSSSGHRQHLFLWHEVGFVSAIKKIYCQCDDIQWIAPAFFDLFTQLLSDFTRFIFNQWHRKKGNTCENQLNIPHLARPTSHDMKLQYLIMKCFFRFSSAIFLPSAPKQHAFFMVFHFFKGKRTKTEKKEDKSLPESTKPCYNPNNNNRKCTALFEREGHYLRL